MAAYSHTSLADFATQAVSNTLWGCAVLNFYDPDLYNAASADIQGAPSHDSLSTRPLTCVSTAPDLHERPQSVAQASGHASSTLPSSLAVQCMHSSGNKTSNSCQE